MADPSGPLDLLLVNGTIHARHGAAPQPALGVRAGRVVALGGVEELASLRGPATEVIDLSGRTVIPGFVDAHVHFLWWCLGQERVQLDGLPRLDDALAAVAAEVARIAPGRWIEGQGWNKNLWGIDFPDRWALDRVAPAHPVALHSKDGHALWANGEALRRAAITADTPDPPGGRLLRDGRGEPTGILLENAQELLERVIEPPGVEACVEALRRGFPAALAMGLTGLHDLGAGVPHATRVQAYRALEREGALPLRVALGVPLELLPSAADLGLWSGLGSERLWIGPVKIFTDGALGPQTAWMLEPYRGSDDRGIPTIEPERLTGALRRAAAAGLGVAMHAIGDAAVRFALDAVGEERRAQAPLTGTPPTRIEHAQHVDPADVPRFAQLGVVASMQPIHATSDMEIADRHLGQRARYGYAWRALLDAGATLAFGTDAPVEPLDPLRSLHAAVTRQRADGTPAGGWHPDQRLTLDEAVRAYTLGSAIAAGVERNLGDLQVGKRADLVVLSRDVFREPAEALLETRADLTLVAGEVVHAAR
jgi:predicted amidohydrolase YtcJ